MAMLESGNEYTERQHGSPREGRGTRPGAFDAEGFLTMLEARMTDGWMDG